MRRRHAVWLCLSDSEAVGACEGLEILFVDHAAKETDQDRCEGGSAREARDLADADAAVARELFAANLGRKHWFGVPLVLVQRG